MQGKKGKRRTYPRRESRTKKARFTSPMLEKEGASIHLWGSGLAQYGGVKSGNNCSTYSIKKAGREGVLFFRGERHQKELPFDKIKPWEKKNPKKGLSAAGGMKAQQERTVR